MFYDLHIHSALSPCGENDMTPNNVINMAKIKGLDIIAVTDHNSTLALKAFDEVAKNLNIKFIYGVEIQTIEEVHVLAYFKTLNDALKIQDWLEEKLIKIKNDVKFFGHQYVTNHLDEVVSEYENLLIASINETINNVCDYIHQNNGAIVLAHVLDKANSITRQLGFIPNDLAFDGLEVKNADEIIKVKKMYPWIKDTVWLINSDAHQLVDISEAINRIDEKTLNRLWRKNG